MNNIKNWIESKIDKIIEKSMLSQIFILSYSQFSYYY